MKTKSKIYLFLGVFFFLSMLFVNIDLKIAKADYDSECKSMYGPYSYYDSEADDCGNKDYSDGSTAGGFMNEVSSQASTYDYDSECKSMYGPYSYYDSAADDCGNKDYSDGSTSSGYMNNNSILGKAGSSCTSSPWYSYSSDGCENGFTCEDGVCVTSWMGETFGIGQEREVVPVKVQTAEQIAQAKKAADAAETNALALTRTQNAATRVVNEKTALMEKACSSGATQSAECIKAQEALNAAKDEFNRATGEAEAAIANLNMLYSAAGIGNPDTGAGFEFCVNGMLARVCETGGTPITAGLSFGGEYSYSGGDSGLGTVSGLRGATPPKCGANFQDIGGVCFPMGTGLSNAPIYLILSNLFSWLMGLFTTFAVIAFVVSGIQYFMSTGNEDMAETAKDNAKAALVGIIVGLSGFIIIKAIAAALSGQTFFF